MATLLMFPPKVHFIDSDGDPLVGGKVFTYEPGLSTPKDTYADKAQVATNTNPVILDARGEAEIWLDGEYGIIIKDVNDVEIYTVDNVSTEGTSNVTTFSEWLTTGDTPTFINTTQFSVKTDLTATYHVGRRVRIVQTSGTVYGVITASAYITVTTITVKLDIGLLDSGISVGDVGLLSANNYAWPLQKVLYGGLDYIADTGLVNAYVADFAPPVPSLVTGTEFSVNITNTNTITAPTLNPNGLGAETIKLESGGALLAGDLGAGKVAEFRYDGTDLILLNPEVSRADKAIRDVSRNLVMQNNSTNPAYQVDITVDEVILQNVNGIPIRVASVTKTVDISASGVDGLDTGSEAIDTWYHIWLIAKADGTVASLLSLASTIGSITFPTDYIYATLLGATRNDGSSDLIPFIQEGKRALYDANQTIKDGSFATGAWTAQSVAVTFPSTAKKIRVTMGSVNIQMAVSPRSDGHAGSYNDGANGTGTTTFGGVFPTGRISWVTHDIRYASSIYYWVSNGGSTMVAEGWEF